MSCNDPLMATNLIRINTFALVARLPTMYGIRERLEGGGLMSYGPNITDLFRRAGDYVDKILRGAKAGRPPGRAADQIRSRHQPDHREGAWPHRAADAARPRRRGDRMRAARVHHAARRRGGVAARGARAAARAHAADRRADVIYRKRQ